MYNDDNDDVHEFIAHLKLPTHAVHIHYDQDQGIVRCFKYREIKGQCDFAVFPDTDIDSIADYLQEQFEDFGYGFEEGH
jgi:hypothetical protein